MLLPCKALSGEQVSRPILPEHQAQATPAAAAAQAPTGSADEEKNGYHARQNHAATVPTGFSCPQHSQFPCPAQHSPDASAAALQPATDPQLSRRYVPDFSQCPSQWPASSSGVPRQAWAPGLPSTPAAVPSSPATPATSAATAAASSCCCQDGTAHRDDGTGPAEPAELPGQHEWLAHEPPAATAAHDRTNAATHADGARATGTTGLATWYGPRTVAWSCRANAGSSDSTTRPRPRPDLTAGHDDAASHDAPGAATSAGPEDADTTAAWCASTDTTETWCYSTQRPPGPSAYPQVSQLAPAAAASPQHPQIKPSANGCFYQTANGQVPCQPATTAAAGRSATATWYANNAGHGHARRGGAEAGDAPSTAPAASCSGHGRIRGSRAADERSTQPQPTDPGALPSAALKTTTAAATAAATTGSDASGPPRPVPCSGAGYSSFVLPAPHAATAAADSHAGTHGSDGPAWHGDGLNPELTSPTNATTATAATSPAAAAGRPQAANGLSCPAQPHEPPDPPAGRPAPGWSPPPWPACTSQHPQQPGPFPRTSSVPLSTLAAATADATFQSLTAGPEPATALAAAPTSTPLGFPPPLGDTRTERHAAAA